MLMMQYSNKFKLMLTKKVLLLFLLLVTIFMVIIFEPVSAASTQNYILMVSAVVQRNPPQITISWPNNTTNDSGYRILRRKKGVSNWEFIADIPKGSVSYTVTDVPIGVAYEYEVQMLGGTKGSGYIYAGIDMPAAEKQGKVILIVDNTFASQLNGELERLQQDLIGDGWEVIRHDVFPSDSPQTVKAMIKADYDADPGNVRSVFLFGHIPVFKSGLMSPDGHEGRAWPADSYYGDMDGEWSVTNPPIYIPTYIELEVGRVDMSNLPAFAPLTEADLLKRYLDKDHKYRHSLMNLQRRGFIDDKFEEFGGEAFAKNGWGNFPQLCDGAASVESGSWRNTLLEKDYLWSYICGGGTYTSVGGTQLSTADLARNSYKTTFALMFGSYFGEWDTQDNLLRAFLAMPDYGLTNAWAGRPRWFMHHMGLGEPIGYSTKVSQNHDGYALGDIASKNVHVALMGDPTLRLYPVKPPANVYVSANSNGKKEITWDSQTQTALGYYVYRADEGSDVFERITPNVVTGNYFEDVNSTTGSYTYEVRTVKLETSASGSFYNLSQGIFATEKPVDVIYSSYISENGKVQINGSAAKASQPVAINVINPSGVISYIDQIDSGTDRNFTLSFPLKQPFGGIYQANMGRTGLDIPVQSNFEIRSIDTIKPSEILFKDSNGGRPAGLIKNTYLKAETTIINEGDSDTEVSFIIALYGANHNLRNISVKNFNVNAGAEETTIQSGFDLPDNVDGCYVKAFIWDGFENMQNVSNVVVFPQS